MGVGKKNEVTSILNDGEDWRPPIVRFPKGERLGNKRELESLERKAIFYYLVNEELLRMTLLPVDAKCMLRMEAMLVLRRAHGEVAQRTHELDH